MTTLEELTEKLKNAPQDVLDRVMGYLDALTSSEEEAEIIKENQQQEAQRRLKMYKENPESALDFNTVMEEIEKDAG